MSKSKTLQELLREKDNLEKKIILAREEERRQREQEIETRNHEVSQFCDNLLGSGVDPTPIKLEYVNIQYWDSHPTFEDIANRNIPFDMEVSLVLRITKHED